MLLKLRKEVLSVIYMELSLAAVSDADIRIFQVFMEMLGGLVDGSKVLYPITKVHDSIKIEDKGSRLLFILYIPGEGLSKCIFYSVYISLYSVIVPMYSMCLKFIWF